MKPLICYSGLVSDIFNNKDQDSKISMRFVMQPFSHYHFKNKLSVHLSVKL